MTALAIVFPLLTALVLAYFSRFNINQYFSSSERHKLHKLVTDTTPEEEKKTSYKDLFSFIFFVLLIDGVQRLLIHASSNSEAAAYFSSRGWDDSAYATIPAIFLSILITGNFSLRRQIATADREYIRHHLLMSAYGISNYRYYQWQKTIVLTCGALLLILNILSWGTFIQIDDQEFRFRNFSELNIRTVKFDDIACVTLHKRRRVPTGEIKQIPFFEIRLHDGSTIDTFHLVGNRQRGKFIKALKSAMNNRLVYQRTEDWHTGSGGVACETAKDESEPVDLMPGYDALQSGDFDTAEEFFSNLTEVHPDNRDVRLYLGNTLVRLNRFDEATVHLLKAIELGGRETESEALLAWAYLQLGNNHEAIKHYTVLIEHDPSQATAYLNRAGIYIRLGETVDAKDDLIHACDLGDKNACSLLHRHFPD